MNLFIICIRFGKTKRLNMKDFLSPFEFSQLGLYDLVKVYHYQSKDRRDLGVPSSLRPTIYKVISVEKDLLVITPLSNVMMGRTDLCTAIKYRGLYGMKPDGSFRQGNGMNMGDFHIYRFKKL